MKNNRKNVILDMVLPILAMLIVSFGVVRMNWVLDHIGICAYIDIMIVSMAIVAAQLIKRNPEEDE